MIKGALYRRFVRKEEAHSDQYLNATIGIFVQKLRDLEVKADRIEERLGKIEKEISDHTLLLSKPTKKTPKRKENVEVIDDERANC